MLLSLLLLALPDADAVERWRPAATPLPVPSPCVVAPRNKKPASTVPAGEASDASAAGAAKAEADKYPGWTTYAPDTAPALPDALRARIQTPPAADRPLQPLVGAPGDIQRVQALWASRPDHPLRIAVWGDSHTFGDALVGQLRRVLQAQLGDAGTGCVMPFAPFTTTPIGRVTTCATGDWTVLATARTVRPGFGPAGAAAVSRTQGAAVWLDVDEEARPGATLRLGILYERSTTGGSFSVTVDSGAPHLVATKGEAGTEMLEVEVPLGPHRLSLGVVGDGEVRLGGVTLERPPLTGTGVVVDGIGVGTRPLAAWSQWNTLSMQQVLAWRPYDLVLLVAGTADANHRVLDEAGFRASVRAALAAFRVAVPDAPCVLVTPGDRAVNLGDGRVALWPHHTWVNAALAELAPEAGCATWNLQADMGGVGTAIAWRDAGLMQPDLLHFTPAGYAEIGNRLLRALQAATPSGP